MIHRHLEYPEDTAPEDLPSAAIVDLLRRGDLDEWRPLAKAVASDPFGALASRLLRLLSAYPIYGTSALWRAWIDRARARLEGPLGDHRAWTLAGIRADEGLTQRELARHVGMSQSDLSKFERRPDVRVSTLRSYLAGLGGTLSLVYHRSGSARAIELARPDEPDASASPRAPGGSSA